MLGIKKNLRLFSSSSLSEQCVYYEYMMSELWAKDKRRKVGELAQPSMWRTITLQNLHNLQKNITFAPILEQKLLTIKKVTTKSLKTLQKMKRILLILIVLITGGLQAQNQVDKAKKLLDEVYAKMSAYNNIYIDFKYNLDNLVENINQETKGNVTIAKDKYVLNYLGATKMYDGNKTYTVVPENEEVTIEKNATDDSAITPSKMLTFYKKGYKYKWDIQQNVRGRKIQYVELKPQKANTEVKQILLGIDIQTKHIYNLIEIGKNGTRTTITVNTFKTNQPLSDNIFKFDREKYKKDGYTISEL